jgi:hypothetical protein
MLPGSGGWPGEAAVANVVEGAEDEAFSWRRDHVRELPATRAEKARAIRLGWNDAAFGRPRRQVPDHLARAYELGYAGGLLFRRKNP